MVDVDNKIMTDRDLKINTDKILNPYSLAITPSGATLI